MMTVHTGDQPRLPHVVAVGDAAAQLTMAMSTMTASDPATRAVADALASLASIGWVSQKVRDDAYKASAWLERAGPAPSSPARPSSGPTNASLPASGLTAEQQARVDATVDRIEREHQQRETAAAQSRSAGDEWAAAHAKPEAKTQGSAAQQGAGWDRAYAAAGMKPKAAS